MATIKVKNLTFYYDGGYSGFLTKIDRHIEDDFMVLIRWQLHRPPMDLTLLSAESSISRSTQLAKIHSTKKWIDESYTVERDENGSLSVWGYKKRK